MGAVNPLRPITSSPWWHHDFFVAAVAEPVPMARAAFALSAHRSQLASAREGRTALEDEVGRLASGVGSVAQWRQRLFVDAGFTGNGADYHDPRNSFLPDVLARRLGIPISLALVGQLVAERAGLVSWGIGLPGHFLLAVAPGGAVRGEWWESETRIVDAFAGGRTMSMNDVVALFSSMFGDRQPFHRSMLDATPGRQILVRMLANLKANYARKNDLDGLTAVVRMRTCLPDWTLDEGRELVRLHSATGSLDEALAVLDELDTRFPSAVEVLASERTRVAVALN